MVQAQHGDPDAPLPQAAHVETVPAPATGRLQRLDARAIGVAAWRLGAGRATKKDAVSATAGVVCLAKPGDAVEAGAPLLELHCDEPARFGRAHDALEDAIAIGPDTERAADRVIEFIRQDDVDRHRDVSPQKAAPS
jgi:thymidine phosphorylase